VSALPQEIMRENRPMQSIDDLRLSVVMPAFNEEGTIAEIIDRVMAVPVRKELIVVDDGSTDRTRAILAELAAIYPEPDLRVVLQPENRGKGAALRTGISMATGDYVVIQDADLEYDPQQYPFLLEPVIADQADVVYGSRFAGGSRKRVLYFWHYLGNRFLTTLSNMFTDLNFSDMETCYKLFRREIIQGITIEQDRFGFEPEVTAKISHRGLRIYEVGITYSGRGYEEGKKIGWKDGVEALWCIIKYGLRQRRRYPSSSPYRKTASRQAGKPPAA
jgi:glycosyltransferase involved in cell wall biosynthesis